MLKLIDQRATHVTIAQRLGRSLNAVEAQLFKLRHPEKYQAKLAKARTRKQKPCAVVIPFPVVCARLVCIRPAVGITLATSAGEFASSRIKGLSRDIGRSAARV